jgi:hypothetical protein
MNHLTLLHTIPPDGWIVLMPEKAATLLRCGLVERVPGYGYSYRLTRAGMSLLETMRRVRA